MGNFVIGLDLGQAADYTAVAVVEKVRRWTKGEREVGRSGAMTQTVRGNFEQPSHYHVRHLERYALGTLYPAIVANVQGLLSRPALRGAPLVVDATGVGRAVVDMFSQRKLDPIPVTITGGDSITRSGRYWRVPKRELVGSVQAPLQDQRLRFAEGMPLAPTLVDEMLRFQVSITDAGHDTYSHREGAHDDLILSVMLACWWAQRPERRPPALSVSLVTM